MVKDRYLRKVIGQLCFPKHKMAFISGPRQCGKTTLAKGILKVRKVGKYFNWDEKLFRKDWGKDPLDLFNKIVIANTESIPLVILDEVHKAKLWKRNLKGVFDSLEKPFDIIVTGSAKLNVYRRGSE